MIDMILDILHEKKIDNYSIVDSQTESGELFYIKKNLDLTRSKDVREIELTVYRDSEKDGKRLRGSSTTYLFPDMDKEQLEALINEAWECAVYVENPYYELPKGKTDCVGVISSDIADESLVDASLMMAAALYSQDNMTDTFVNSTEIFAEKKSRHIITSSGCNVTYTKFNINGEFVVQSLANGNDVELHQQFNYDTLNTRALADKCAEALRTVKDRAAAQKAPVNLEGIPVIICDSYVKDLLDFYMYRSNVTYTYPKYSPYEPGYDAQKDAVGERLNITMLPQVPYNSEGVEMSEHVLMKDGIIQCLHGPVRYAYYMGTAPIGTYDKLSCSNGSTAFEEMTKAPYILVKTFSDFQMDEMDGHFGGEFRLAYYYDGETTRILTGGTVSGNLFEAQKNMQFSTERYEDSIYSGPKYLKVFA